MHMLLLCISEWYTIDFGIQNMEVRSNTNTTLMLSNKFLLHLNCHTFSLPFMLHCLKISWMPWWMDISGIKPKTSKIFAKKQGKQVSYVGHAFTMRARDQQSKHVKNRHKVFVYIQIPRKHCQEWNFLEKVMKFQFVKNEWVQSYYYILYKHVCSLKSQVT